ncbi:MAG: hypothetical protein SPK92_02510 [Bacilli bacterium]|nr:hypothetical protein [Bacilli bacterium]MDY5745222.1 hypothetical protein [Bacilli bacterium]MDY6008745.1 hypothetical protein [Bacilli bacterium]
MYIPSFPIVGKEFNTVSIINLIVFAFVSLVYVITFSTLMYHYSSKTTLLVKNGAYDKQVKERKGKVKFSVLKSLFFVFCYICELVYLAVFVLSFYLVYLKQEFSLGGFLFNLNTANENGFIFTLTSSLINLGPSPRIGFLVEFAASINSILLVLLSLTTIILLRSNLHDVRVAYKERYQVILALESTPAEEVKEEKVEEIKEEPVKEESVEEVKEEPITVESTEEVKEEPAKEESTEEVKEESITEESIEEVKEEPVEEVKEDVEEAPLKEESVDEEETKDDDVETQEHQLTPTINRSPYDVSFVGRLHLIDVESQQRYVELKQELAKYSLLSDRISWKQERFSFHKVNLAKFVVRGKSLMIYFNIDVAKLENLNLRYEVLEGDKNYTIRVKLTNRLKQKSALELVKYVMYVNELKLRRTPLAVEYEVANYDEEKLVELGLAKKRI